MKKYSTFLCLLTLLWDFSVAQEKINYGSNKGKYLKVDKTRLYYEEYGKGTPVLLIHGFMGSISNYQGTIPELAKAYRVIAVDSPGHGRSEHPDSLSYQLMANYFSEIIDLLKLDSVYVIGYSDGAQTAMILTADRPDKVKKVIAVSGAYRTDGFTQVVAESYNLFTPEFVEANMKEWLDEYKTLSPQRENWKKLFADNKKMYYSSQIVVAENKLKQIATPMLLVYGDQDAITLDHALQLHKLIGTSQFCVLPGASHFAFFERPDLANQVTLQFLK